MPRPVVSWEAALAAPDAPSSVPTRCTCLVPAAVHDLVDGVGRQLGPVESVALGDLHDHLRVVIQVIGLLPQAEHFPHQDPCATRRGTGRQKGKSGCQKVQFVERASHTTSGRLRVRARGSREMSPSKNDRVWRVELYHHFWGPGYPSPCSRSPGRLFCR